MIPPKTERPARWLLSAWSIHGGRSSRFSSTGIRASIAAPSHQILGLWCITPDSHPDLHVRQVLAGAGGHAGGGEALASFHARTSRTEADVRRVLVVGVVSGIAGAKRGPENGS